MNICISLLFSKYESIFRFSFSFFSSCSDAHEHISVHTPGWTPVASAHANLNKMETSFLAGELEHLSALALLSLPLASSYKRMVVLEGLMSPVELNTKKRLYDCAILILLRLEIQSIGSKFMEQQILISL